MKRYEINDISIAIRVIKSKPHETILNIRYDGSGEQEIIVPDQLFKKQFNDNSFAKHILNFFIKE